MKCLVTGGAGFIGSHIVDRLILEGHEVVIVDNMSTGKPENINPKALHINEDISDTKVDWNYILQGVDTVFHVAAAARVQPSIENPVKFHDVNVNGTHNLLYHSKEAGVKRFIFSSSSSVYGNVKQIPTPEDTELNPISPYALHKLMGEYYCKLYSKLYDIETVCLRYFNVYGDRQVTEGAYCLVMGVFVQQILNGNPMTIRGDGEQRRDFTYVGDIVDANIRCMNYKSKLSGDVFNVGNGYNRSVNDIAGYIGGETINVDPVIEPKVTLADNTKAKEVLGWKTTQKLEEWIPNWKKKMGL